MIHPVGWTQFPEFSKIFYLAGLFAACDYFCFQLENGFSRLCKSGGKNKYFEFSLASVLPRVPTSS